MTWVGLIQSEVRTISKKKKIFELPPPTKLNSPSLLPLPVPAPNGGIQVPGPGSAHPNAPQQPVDGAVDNVLVDSAVAVALSATAETANRSINLIATRTTTLEGLPAELRRRILAHVAGDLGSLTALTLASPVLYQQYLLDRKALLGAGSRQYSATRCQWWMHALSRRRLPFWRAGCLDK
jgi:hypothetical protein